ncbi:MAG: ABC transporter permease, partial [Verrucomicrobiota bacterium]
MDFSTLLRRYGYWLFRGFWKPRYIRPHALFDQMTNIGVLALPSVSMACMFMGIVLVMQGAYQLKQVGAVDYVADLVGVSMFREIGPLITAVIVIGRSASSVTAELGTMKVSEEIDALHVMGVDPV